MGFLLGFRAIEARDNARGNRRRGFIAAPGPIR
jgi:hypothetical protein